MKKRVLFYCLASLSLLTVACTDHDGVGTVPDTDRNFMLVAADANLFEIEAGKIAENKGVTDSVRQYGHHMVVDHSMATQELKALADKKMVSLPMSVSPIKQMKLDTLAMMSGMAFDSTYSVMMVKSHIETIALFEKETMIGEDAEVKSFAASKLPTLKHHLEEAEKLMKSVL